MLTEADTCTKLILPRLQAAGWDGDPHSFCEQHTFTAGRIITAGTKARRKPKKRADYLLRYTRDFTIAVVEAKPEDATPGEGLQQAKEYAEILGLSFAYSTNGHSIIEFDYLTGRERELDAFPSPAELWHRLTAARNLTPATHKTLLEPYNIQAGKTPHYYQQIAINRAVESILQSQQRILLTMATGTGKTLVAFQICWKLWNARWNRTGEYRRPKILYLADRNILIDDPKDKTFAPFGDARFKIEGGRINFGREIYFAIYQAIAKDEFRPGLYREYPPDFFDLIIVDECHRGSASEESNWREILEYFQPAFQLGMTATPKRQDNIDTYRYFGTRKRGHKPFSHRPLATPPHPPGAFVSFVLICSSSQNAKPSRFAPSPSFFKLKSHPLPATDQATSPATALLSKRDRRTTRPGQPHVAGDRWRGKWLGRTSVAEQ